MNNRLVVRLIALFGVLAGLSGEAANEPVKPASPPRLGIVIVVDQMTPDYLTRFDSLYVGGFRRLLDGGAVCLHGIHDHAATETAVGHTTISTGFLPSHHGIIGNYYYDRKAERDIYAMFDSLSPLVGEPVGKGSSPVNISEPTLGDQLKEMSRASHVFSVALKDRSAIGMGGKRADGVYWFNWKTGNYVTSRFYTDEYPEWIDSFNQGRQVDSYFADGWRKLLPEEAYADCNADASPNENDGVHNVFPHLFTEHSDHPDTTYWDELYATPYPDQVTLALAKTALRHEELGWDEAPDLLWVGCSAADAVGHTYGPLSQEAKDYYLRLDRSLGDFFNYLDSTLGANAYVVALSSDHGVLPMPEDLKKRGLDAGRINPDSIKADIKRIGGAIAAAHGFPRSPIRSGTTDLLLDYTVTTPGKERWLEEIVASEIRKLPYVEDVFGRHELLDASTPDRPYLQKFRNCSLPDRGVDLMLLTKKNYLVDRDSFGTTHGSPYDYDCTVPIIFYGPGVVPGAVRDTVRTIDIAPTLAALLQIKTERQMDGRKVQSVLVR